VILKKYFKTFCYVKKLRKENYHQGSVLRMYDPYSPHGLGERLAVETSFIDTPAIEGVAIHFFNSSNMYLLVES